MRDLINLVESRNRLPANNYYHASSAVLNVGDKLRSRKGNMLDGDIEEILENNRPDHYLPRSRYVFMCAHKEELDNVAVDMEHLYAVMPAGEVYRLDHAWVNAIWSVVVSEGDDGNAMTPELIDKCNEYAAAYWDKKISRFGIRAPISFEYLTTGATVTKVFY